MTLRQRVKDLSLPRRVIFGPECGLPLHAARIEVGQVFQLGTKYSQRFTPPSPMKIMRDKPWLWGCYGIGVL